jgi:hypothetical protein
MQVAGSAEMIREQRFPAQTCATGADDDDVEPSAIEGPKPVDLATAIYRRCEFQNSRHRRYRLSLTDRQPACPMKAGSDFAAVVALPCTSPERLPDFRQAAFETRHQ